MFTCVSPPVPGDKQCVCLPIAPMPPPVHPSPGSDLVAAWLCSLPLTTQQLADNSFEPLLSSGRKQGGCYAGHKPQAKRITQQRQQGAPLC